MYLCQVTGCCYEAQPYDVLCYPCSGRRDAWKRRLAILAKLFPCLLLVLLTGCSGPSLKLDPVYLPLAKVEEDPTHLLMPADVVTTVFSTVWTNDLATWEQNNPAGPVRDAILQHERIHSVRQSATGIGWFARYLTEPSFRWDEEQQGWAIQIHLMRNAGMVAVPEGIAAFLSGPAYTVAGTPMVSYADALAWVYGQVQGQ